MLRRLVCRIVGHRFEQAEIPYDRCRNCGDLRVSWVRIDPYRYWRTDD